MDAVSYPNAKVIDFFSQYLAPVRVLVSSTPLPHLDRLISEYPKSDVSPEAIYYRGVSRYKATNDASALKQAHETLQAKYKDSEWAKRASVDRLL